MKKVYTAPEIEVLKITLCDTILSSITEGTTPVTGNGDTSEPENELPVEGGL